MCQEQEEELFIIISFSNSRVAQRIIVTEKEEINLINTSYHDDGG